MSQLEIRNKLIKKLRIAVLCLIIFITIILILIGNYLNEVMLFRIGGILSMGFTMHCILYTVELLRRNKIAATINGMISAFSFITALYLLLK